MKITPELLEKFANGHCSEEEISHIQQWLSQENETDTSDGHELIKKKVWSNLLRSNPGLREIGNNWGAAKLMRYAAAVTLLGGVGMAIALKFNPVDGEYITIKNKQTHLISQTVSKYELTLGKHTYIHFKENAWRKKIDVGICGDMKLVNNSGDEVKLNLHDLCGSGQDDIQLTLYNGKSYLAIQLDFNGNEMLVVDRDRVYDLPPRIQGKIKKTFSI